MSQLQQQYHFVEVYDDGTRHCLKKSQIKQDSELSVINYNYINKQESEILPDIEAIESNSSDQSIEDKRRMADSVATSVDLMDLKRSLCKQIDDSLLVFRRKLNQSLEKKFDVLEAKMADIQNDIEDLKTLMTEQKPVLQSSHRTSQRMRTPPRSSVVSPAKRLHLDDKVFTLSKLQEKYDCYFPLKTRKDFEDFDEMITDEFYNDLKMHLISAINTDKSLKVTCSAMFKQLFSREVLTSMTAQKKNKIKLLFKETKFFACLKEAMREAFYGIDVIEEKELLKAVGSVINNSIDWEGHRVKRQKVSATDTETNKKD